MPQDHTSTEIRLVGYKKRIDGCLYMQHARNTRVYKTHPRCSCSDLAEVGVGVSVIERFDDSVQAVGGHVSVKRSALGEQIGLRQESRHRDTQSLALLDRGSEDDLGPNVSAGDLERRICSGRTVARSAARSFARSLTSVSIGLPAKLSNIMLLGKPVLTSVHSLISRSTVPSGMLSPLALATASTSRMRV